MFQEHLKDVLSVSMLFQGSLKIAAKKFQWCFREISRVYQKCWKGDSRKFYFFLNVSKKLRGTLKGVSIVF